MTAQASELLLFNGEHWDIQPRPLDRFFELGGRNPGFVGHRSSNRRGYVGSWEIIDQRLYLVELSAELASGATASLGEVFPGFPHRVFAHWFSGTLRLHAASHSCERVLQLDRGVVAPHPVHRNGAESPTMGKVEQPAQDCLQPIQQLDWDVQPHHLQQRMTVAEVERIELVKDPLSAVPQRPFGHLNDAWNAFSGRCSKDMPIWSFHAKMLDLGGSTVTRAGYVFVYGEVPGQHFLSTWGQTLQELFEHPLTSRSDSTSPEIPWFLKRPGG